MAGKTIGEQTRGKRPDPIAEAAIVHEPAEPRPPRMAAVETLGRGDHACVWFDGHEDRWALRAAFATVGLARGERVMFFPGPGTPAKEAIERLAAFGVPAAGPSAGAEAPIRRPGSARPGGHVEVIDVQPGYVRGRGLDVAARIRHWTKVSGETLAHGFTGLRAAGDMTWAVGADVDGGELAAYEAAMTGLLAKLGLTGVCEYDRGGTDRTGCRTGRPGGGRVAPATRCCDRCGPRTR